MQLKLALLVTMPATLRAWKSRLAVSHGPGTTMTGLMLPSSLVMSFLSSGSLRARRPALSGPGGPHTIASCVLSEPVM